GGPKLPASGSLGGAGERLDPWSRALAALGIALALYLYLGRLDGTPLQRGNEAMYASPPALMLKNRDWLVPIYRGDHFLDKPILPIWVVAASYRLLGVSVFAERLPIALAGLATCLLLGLWVGRRSGERAGVLASLALAFSFLFVFTGMTFVADAFLTLSILAAAIVLDGACRVEGSDLAWGVASGAALALAFYFKGLVGIVLPAGAVVATLAIDRRFPRRIWARAAWALLALVALLAPYHVAMDRRLGWAFWDVFYWKNQFLRGASHIYMRPNRGPLFYVGLLAWGLFPWALQIPVSIRRARPSSLPLGALAFGLAFWSPLVMKREVYGITLLPAAAALVAEGFATGGRGREIARRVLWALGAAFAVALLVVLVRAFPFLTRAAGADVVRFLLASLLLLAASLAACAAAPRSPREALAAALACGLVCLGGRLADERFGRFDPLPAWGERARAACASGCDGFVFGEDVTSLEFYSGFDWMPVIDPGREIPALMRHRTAFVVMRSSMEAALAELPYRYEVLDRCATYGSYSIDQFLGPRKGSDVMLSLVRIQRTDTPLPPGEGAGVRGLPSPASPGSVE
ncbi:MAG TPA: glycosyltransferase family 39 protein, partial [Thermoanaerobaculia bacterium]|nr:glycosyltransferase family 39 protein [Thermoanaerobaculia bacterium]